MGLCISHTIVANGMDQEYVAVELACLGSDHSRKAMSVAMMSQRFENGTALIQPNKTPQ